MIRAVLRVRREEASLRMELEVVRDRVEEWLVLRLELEEA